MYYFVDWKLTEEGYVPALPEELSVELFAEPREHGTYALYKINLWREEAVVYGLKPVPDTFAVLLGSAEQYPPALAIARGQVRRMNGDIRADFAENLESCLRVQLAAQLDQPFFLALNRVWTGYKEVGGYYWIIGYQRDRVGNEIKWISRDYVTYTDPVTDFDVDAAVLETRFYMHPNVATG